jgi:hypothetical protein
VTRDIIHHWRPFATTVDPSFAHDRACGARGFLLATRYTSSALVARWVLHPAAAPRRLSGRAGALDGLTPPIPET